MTGKRNTKADLGITVIKAHVVEIPIIHLIRTMTA